MKSLDAKIKSLCLTAFVDLETLWMETSRPDPEDEAKVQAHEVLRRKPEVVVTKEHKQHHATFFLEDDVPRWKGKGRGKGRRTAQQPVVEQLCVT